MVDKIKIILTLISIALISSFFYAIFQVLLTQIINLSTDIWFAFYIFPHLFAGTFPYFILAWVPLSLLIEKLIQYYNIHGYLFKLIIYCFVGFISFFIYGIVLNLGNIFFLSILTFSLIFGITTAFVFYNTMILYKATLNKELKPNTKRLITLFVLVLAVFSLNLTITGDYSNHSFEEFYNIEEVLENSPLGLKLPSNLPDGVYFNNAQIYQDRNEIIITISYSGNKKEFDWDTPLILTVTDKNMKKELLERHDKLKEISINDNKGYIGRSAIIGDYEYMDVTLMWNENEIYYSLSTNVYENSILDEDDLLKIAKSFK
ncbi:DUF4367 domain-containing protein [Halalkalibacter lacteus]|uniref:DUF4367 domain-containing protein n=1 Tax=Halalkalibacter lacteus TaxID=3090663 RepID=UPI002FC75BCA